MSGKYTITNRMQRAFIVPDSPSHAHVAINPGSAEAVDVEHWDHIRKGNAVIDALLLDRHLVVERGDKAEANAVPARELTNPGSPTAPEELAAPEGVKVEIKQEKAAEVDLQNEPTAGTGTVAARSARTAAPAQTKAPAGKKR